MINTIVISGKLADDIEIKKSKNNSSYCSFSIIHEKFNGGKFYARCLAFGNTADKCKGSKGDEVVLQGSYDISISEYQGEKKEQHSIVISNFENHNAVNVTKEFEKKFNDAVTPSLNVSIEPNDLPFF